MSIEHILLLIVVGVAAWIVLVYNRLITQQHRFKNAFSQIDVQLTRRYELIPNLISVAGEYMKHERETLTAVVEARNQAKQQCEKTAAHPEQPELLQALASAEARLSQTLGKMNLVIEDYPELKADERMADLHRELTSTENRVAYARQAFSDAVMHYNIEREHFPTVIVARLFNFGKASLFEIDNSKAREPIQVNFA